MNRSAMRSRTSRLLALSLAALLPLGLAACGSADAPPPLAGAKIGGPFTLSDKGGKPVRWDDFAGQYRMIYFGYTFCPDVCPLDVATMMQGYARFEKAEPELAKQVQPIFVTIDPARDTPAIVGEFSAAFSPRLLGLTGTADQVAAAAKAFAVYYARGNQTAGGYLMDHSRNAFLMGPKGEPIAMLSVDEGAAKVAAELETWVK